VPRLADAADDDPAALAVEAILDQAQRGDEALELLRAIRDDLDAVRRALDARVAS